MYLCVVVVTCTGIIISKETVNPQAQPNELFKHYSLPEYDKTGTYAEEYGRCV